MEYTPEFDDKALNRFIICHHIIERCYEIMTSSFDKIRGDLKDNKFQTMKMILKDAEIAASTTGYYDRDMNHIVDMLDSLESEIDALS